MAWNEHGPRVDILVRRWRGMRIASMAYGSCISLVFAPLLSTFNSCTTLYFSGPLFGLTALRSEQDDCPACSRLCDVFNLDDGCTDLQITGWLLTFKCGTESASAICVLIVR